MADPRRCEAQYTIVHASSMLSYCRGTSSRDHTGRVIDWSCCSILLSYGDDDTAKNVTIYPYLYVIEMLMTEKTTAGGKQLPKR